MKQSIKTTEIQPAKTHISTRKELLLFLLIPASVILLTALFLWLPGVLAHPKYDFLYSACPDYACRDEYTAVNGSIRRQRAESSDYYDRSPELYYYSVKTGSAERIDEQQAKSYTLKTTSVSPDGYRLQQANGDGGGGFLFWGNSGDYNWYLKNGLKKKRVMISSGYDMTYVNDNFKLLGWVVR